MVRASIEAVTASVEGIPNQPSRTMEEPSRTPTPEVEIGSAESKEMMGNVQKRCCHGIAVCVIDCSAKARTPLRQHCTTAPNTIPAMAI